jgi:hypothetical protein
VIAIDVILTLVHAPLWLHLLAGVVVHVLAHTVRWLA